MALSCQSVPVWRYAETGLLLALALLAVAVLLLPAGWLAPDMRGALTGALLGAAAVLLGNLTNRGAQRATDADEAASEQSKVEKLVAAELVNVAVGLIMAKQLMQAARETLDHQGHVQATQDLTSFLPRTMPMTDALGARLLILSESALDALTTLRSNLTLTRQRMEDVSGKVNGFNWLQITVLNNCLGDDMGTLATAFERIAPQRMLEWKPGAPELVSTLLRKLASSDAGGFGED